MKIAAELGLVGSEEPVFLSPDGERYMAMAAGETVDRPYHLRWLLPKVLGSNATRWVFVSRWSVLALAPLAWWYTGSPWMACCVFLPGVLLNWRVPVLVDGAAMALALLSACLLPVCWPAAVAVALLGGMVRETSPVWAALWAWNPVLLIGLLPVALRSLQRHGVEADPVVKEILDHPFAAGQKWHRGNWRTPRWMLLPWSGLALGVMALEPWSQLSAQIALGLVFGYAQLLVATDTVRLYQWAWPGLALGCVNALPPQVLPLVALSIVFHPWIWRNQNVTNQRLDVDP